MLKNICLGIDPNFDLLPKKMQPEIKPEIEQKLSFFTESVIDAAAGILSSVKFQLAYFEQFGLVGLKVLSKYINYAKNKGLIIILDAKRGDIGSTSEAYSEAYLSLKSDFEADFLTVNPFLGWDTVKPFIDMAIKNNKGLFLLVQTSNPGAEEFQQSVFKQQTLSENLANKIFQANKEAIEQGWENKFIKSDKFKYGPVGAVVAATKPEEAQKLRKLMPNTPFLCPGFGFQGGDMSMIKTFLNDDGTGAIFPMSRSLTYPKQTEIEKLGFMQAVKQQINNLNFAE
jgi:orotidine-5'-phosphate decarboxylase